MSDYDWQDADPDAYDPDNPLALLEKAAAAGESERAMAVVRAVRCMVAAGADAGVMAVARDYVKRAKILAVQSFDRLDREGRGDDSGADVARPSRRGHRCGRLPNGPDLRCSTEQARIWPVFWGATPRTPPGSEILYTARKTTGIRS